MEIKTEILQVSIRGDKEKDIPNQDYIQIFENEEFLIIAVSDGLGSSKHSMVGAKIACMSVIETIKEFQLSNDIHTIDGIVKKKWLNRVELESKDSREYRTASSFIGIFKKNKKMIVGQLGDVLISLRIDGLFRHLESTSKDFSNETDCLGSGRNEKFKLSLFHLGHSFDFLIATDGIGDEIEIEKVDILHDYFISKFQDIDASKRNDVLKKEIEDFINKKNNDDKSMVFIWTNKI